MSTAKISAHGVKSTGRTLPFMDDHMGRWTLAGLLLFYPLGTWAAQAYAPPMMPEQSFPIWVKVISETGFPIAMSSAFLYLFERRLTRIMILLERMSDARLLRPRDEE